MEMTLSENAEKAVRVLMSGDTSAQEVVEEAIGEKAEREDVKASLARAVADMEAGNMQSLASFDAEFRAEHSFPEN